MTARALAPARPRPAALPPRARIPPRSAAMASGGAGPDPAAAVRVYTGGGAGQRSVRSAVQSLEGSLGEGVEVRGIGPEEVVQGGWEGGCAALVMPGGADLPYCRALNGAGTARIRAYVEGGGSYLGLCAGAYFACSRVEFEPGTELEVVGDRELAFFPGVARGSLFPGFHYATERGSVVAAASFNPTPTPPGKAVAAEEGTWGGEEGEAGAGGGGRRCKGGGLPGRCRVYVNGGPEFEEGSFDGVEVLARFDAGGRRSGGEGGGGGPGGGAAAVLRCRVGGGVAVLSSGHPELTSGWIDPAGPEGDQGAVPAAGGLAAAGGGAGAEHLRALHAELVAAEAGQAALWEAILGACGLPLASRA